MARFVTQYAVNRRFRHRRFRGKSALQPEPRGRDGIGRFEFAHHESKFARIAFDQIPAIGLKLVKDAHGEAGWAVKVDGFLASREQTEQVIKANEMINMRMRDEDLVDTSYLPRRQ